jgi:hypothetical protein
MIVLGLSITSGALTLLYRGDFLYPFIFTSIAALVIPLRAVSLINKLLDTNPIFTEQRTFTFHLAGYTVLHPGGCTDSTWDRYAGLSEDAQFFYLRIPGSRLDVLFPKSAFSGDQMVLFRHCAGQTGI